MRISFNEKLTNKVRHAMIDEVESYQPSEKLIKELKEVLEKQHSREFTWDETQKLAWGLHTHCKIIFNIAAAQIKRQRKLEESPKGFHLDESQPCELCGDRVSGTQSWFDKNGTKCLHCQKAIDQKIIPISVLKDKDSWYSTFELEQHFNIKKKVLGKFLKQGILKDRTVFNDKGKVHIQLFLMIDNKGFFPPKKLLKSRTVKVIYKGEEHFTSEFWYEYVDAALAKKLSKYGIAQYLQELFSQPVNAGRFYYKSINPLFAPEKIWEPTIKNHDDFARASDKSNTD